MHSLFHPPNHPLTPLLTLHNPLYYPLSTNSPSITPYSDSPGGAETSGVDAWKDGLILFRKRGHNKHKHKHKHDEALPPYHYPCYPPLYPTPSIYIISNPSTVHHPLTPPLYTTL